MQIMKRVSDLVIDEAYFGLHYHVPKADALKLLEAFLAEAGISALGYAPAVLATTKRFHYSTAFACSPQAF
jgi:hypothetical protein